MWLWVLTLESAANPAIGSLEGGQNNCSVGGVFHRRGSGQVRDLSFTDRVYAYQDVVPIECLHHSYSVEREGYVRLRRTLPQHADDFLRGRDRGPSHGLETGAVKVANDIQAASPSIFNDDDEFALLTSQDELLLQMLYDPRLKQSMSLEEASPIAHIIARELVDGDL